MTTKRAMASMFGQEPAARKWGAIHKILPWESRQISPSRQLGEMMHNTSKTCNSLLKTQRSDTQA
eukprot:3995589-Amphidinium_carterae.1